MRTFEILLALTLGVQAQVNPGTLACFADGCFLAVTSAIPTGMDLVDCLSYLLTTVTPATSTSIWMVYATTTLNSNPTATVTDTAYVTTTVLKLDLAIRDALVDERSNPLEKRQQPITTLPIPETYTSSPPPGSVTLSAIPSYGSVCNGSMGYSSACLCIGATAATITAPTLITTVNSTSTVTESITITGTATLTVIDTVTTTQYIDLLPPSRIAFCGPTPTFVLSAVGGPYNGQYATLVNAHDGLPEDFCIEFGPKSDASPFSIDSAGRLHSGDEYANIDGDNVEELLFFDTLPFLAEYHYPQATCSVLPSKILQCAAATKHVFQYCPDAEGFGNCPKVASVASPVAGCTEFNYEAIYDCVLRYIV